jgi:crotonobetainyl-CoA:carnitine CoA-transferase CaiB-like acyl-CoA transferase
MYETGVSCIGPAILEAQRGITRPRLGTAHLWKMPHNVYPCQGTDRWITISVSNDAEWERLKTVMGEPAWAAESRFATVPGRWQHQQELDAHLSQWTATYDNQALMQLLQAHGIPAGAVLTAADLVANPHLQARGYLEVFTNNNAPRVGPRVYAGRPFRTQPEPPIALRLVAALGQHNMQLLREVAGLAESDIQRLVEAGVIADRPHETTKPAPGATAYQARGTDTPADRHYREAVHTLTTPRTNTPGRHSELGTPHS